MIRAPSGNPSRVVALVKKEAMSNFEIKKRPGRPKLNWSLLSKTMTDLNWTLTRSGPQHSFTFKNAGTVTVTHFARDWSALARTFKHLLVMHSARGARPTRSCKNTYAYALANVYAEDMCTYAHIQTNMHACIQTKKQQTKETISQFHAGCCVRATLLLSTNVRLHWPA
jgi:hypothetical protein